MKTTSIICYYQAVCFFHGMWGLDYVSMSTTSIKSLLAGIKNVQNTPTMQKDPILPAHLRKMSSVVSLANQYHRLTWTAVLLMFRTLLRVSHIVTSPHQLLRKDIKFTTYGLDVLVHTSKTSKVLERIPVNKLSSSEICPVYYLKELFQLYPRSGSSPLFSTRSVKTFTYTEFRSMFKKFLRLANITGDYSSHSLRRGGATFMSQSGCSLSEIRQRGLWKSDCVTRYIKPEFNYKVLQDGGLAAII